MKVVLGSENKDKIKPSADFWFGLEAGLHNYGEGSEIHLPEKVSDEVKAGDWFGDIVHIYAKHYDIDENLISRTTSFTEAIQNAYANYLVKKQDLGYRQKSAGIIIDEDNNYLIVQLEGYSENDWNFAGGGIENSETAEEALLRELREELGTERFEIVKRGRCTSKYDWPDFVIARRLKTDNKTYKGQEMSFFLVKFVGKKDDIKPDPKEIKKIKWVSREELKHHFNFPNQWKIARKVIQELIKQKDQG